MIPLFIPRLTRAEIFSWILILISIVIAGGCRESQNPVAEKPNFPFPKVSDTRKDRLFLMIEDGSLSSNTTGFNEKIKATCLAIRENLRKGDHYIKIIASADEPIINSPIPITPKLIKEECEARTISSGLGTPTKPSFQFALKIIEQEKALKPIVLIIVHSNEGENDPVSDWRKLAQASVNKGGSFIIVGSTNEGHKKFHVNLLKALEHIDIKTATSKNQIQVLIKDALKN